VSAPVRDAEIVIVGGGALGCGVAYFLARAGCRDVVLLERGALGGATTSQAAGLVGQVRASTARVEVARFSVRTFTALAAETGADPDYRAVGSLRLALTAEREAEFRRLVAVGHRAGLDVDFVSPAEAARRFPLLDGRRIRAAIFCPSDGYVQPHGLVTAYAAGARARGVRIHTDTPVLALAVRRGAVAGVLTGAGEVRAATVVVAAGPWTAALAATAGVGLPLVPVRHQYFVTEPVDGMAPDLPVLRIPDLSLYARGEVRGLLLGGFEPDPESVDPRTLPADAAPLAADWARLGRFGEDAVDVMPAVAEARVRATFQGLPAFTPDGQFCLGPVAAVRGLYMAAGCCAHGVSGSAALAAVAAAEVLGAPPPVALPGARAGRFAAAAVDWPAARRGAEAVYAGYYGLSPAEG
jgi:glycine/D-amino acid oxidase-like deaminating enzyme